MHGTGATPPTDAQPAQNRRRHPMHRGDGKRRPSPPIVGGKQPEKKCPRMNTTVQEKCTSQSAPPGFRRTSGPPHASPRPIRVHLRLFAFSAFPLPCCLSCKPPPTTHARNQRRDPMQRGRPSPAAPDDAVSPHDRHITGRAGETAKLFRDTDETHPSARFSPARTRKRRASARPHAKRWQRPSPPQGHRPSSHRRRGFAGGPPCTQDARLFPHQATASHPMSSAPPPEQVRREKPFETPMRLPRHQPRSQPAPRNRARTSGRRPPEPARPPPRHSPARTP